jgi:beta-lactamase superfamily II metal-dependent hydrolase
MQRSRKPASAAQPQAAPAAAQALPRVAVRMYRQGLGDCFLVTLRREDGTPWRMLIDCGVILGTADTAKRLTEVIANLVADSGGRIDVLVITHEHYDHVAAFAAVPNLFCADEAQRRPEQLQIGEVWFAWSEDPGDPLGNKLRKTRSEQINKLAGMVAGLRARNAAGPASEAVESVATLLGGFFGIEDFAVAALSVAGPAMAAVGGATHVGATAQAMQNARALGGANGRRVRYWKPGDPPWSDKTLPGVRIYVLGPPRDETLLKKTFARDEVYGLAISQAANAAFFAAAGMADYDNPARTDPGAPFDALYGRSLSDKAAMPPGTGDFLQRRYYGPAASDSGSDDQSWRQIDTDWLGSAAQFALNLDSATNNTSLVLAIELAPGGEVLLFPADAQVGNWLSWHQVQWKEDNNTLTASDLLRRTTFYKVGHHGSHNATLRSKGLELMPHGLTALLPVDHDMAVRKHWDGMPLPQLVDAFKERDCIVVRMDDPAPPSQSRVRTGPPADNFAGSLYYEWSFDK